MNMEVKYTSHNVLLTPTFNRLKHTTIILQALKILVLIILLDVL